MELVKAQQKKIDELLETSNQMIAALQLQRSAPKKQPATPNNNKGMHMCNHCKKLTTHQDDDCCCLEKNKDNWPQLYNAILDKRAKTKANKGNKTEWCGMGSRAESNQQCKPSTTVDKNRKHQINPCDPTHGTSWSYSNNHNCICTTTICNQPMHSNNRLQCHVQLWMTGWPDHKQDGS